MKPPRALFKYLATLQSSIDRTTTPNRLGTTAQWDDHEVIML